VVGACGGPPGRLSAAPRSYLRGVNCYTLNYAAAGGRPPRGEPASSYDYLAAHGHRLVRLPFEWGLVQPRLGRALDARFVRALEREVAAIGDAGMVAILDIQSGGRHPATLRESRRFGDGISEAEFADAWRRLSARFAGDPRIHAYDLMNEPFDLADEIWQGYSQAAVTSLRADGDGTLLWVEGNEWSLTGAWRKHQPRPWIDDPLDNVVYSAHAYPGQAAHRPQRVPSSSDAATFLADLADFVAWLQRYGCRGSIGEVGWPSARHVGAWEGANWNGVGDAWYALADRAGLDVTYFGASSAYENWLWAYDAATDALPPPGLRRAESQARVIEAHAGR
jgi:endoglucanase